MADQLSYHLVVKPCQQPYPGPDVPLVEYLPRPPQVIQEVDVRSLPHGLYRALVRCYALEAQPTSIMSVEDWLKHISEDGQQQRVARGARIGDRLDLRAGMIIETEPKVHDLGYIWQPKPTVVKSWWHSDIGSDLSHKMFEDYQYMMLRVLMRVRSLGFSSGYRALIEKRPLGKKFPDPRLAFTRALPGAIVRHHGPAWVIREVSTGVVLIEDEELEQKLVSVNELGVLG